VSNAQHLVDLALSRPPTLGTGRLICIDGPAGSGKSTLAAEVARLSTAPVLHMDDMFEGWDGLPRITDQLESVLRPLASGVAGHYRRWDWERSAWAETVLVPPAALLVLEGVGSGSAAVADLVTVLAWIEVPYDVRLARGLARGGVGVAENWRRWAVGEQRMFTRERTRERADVLLDGQAGSLQR
jgi:energy-coupling factor transporter ATP-binding protein EcfA2